MATIRKRGPYQWQAQIRKTGYPHQSKTFENRAEAEAWARALESEMDRGVFVSRSEAEQTTLGEALERYLREVTPAKKGADREKRKIRLWQNRKLALRPLASIRGADLAEFRDQRLADGKSPYTVNHDLNLISHLFTVAVKEWGMESLRNPVSYIRKPKQPQGRDRRLEGDEEARLLEVADSPYREVITLAIETAMRAGELRTLKWSNIDLEARTATLPDTKNGERRVVPLSSRAAEVLGRLAPLADGDDLFPSMTTGNLAYRFRALCKRAGVKGLRFHDLRHEATSRFFELGLNPMEVAAITGHKTLAMLKRYTHLRAEDLAAKLG
ncbi:tyrosine-type recombinase/integrase, partial [Endothiovibrio diazotrophicus]